MSEIRPTLAQRSPRGMEVARLGSRQAREFIEAEAIDIFTTMTNGGCTFQQALAAIFLSGMNAAHTVRRANE
jgi:hypothetical protein